MKNQEASRQPVKQFFAQDHALVLFPCLSLICGIFHSLSLFLAAMQTSVPAVKKTSVNRFMVVFTGKQGYKALIYRFELDGVFFNQKG